MEQWVPLFDIFLNSLTPETEASMWLQQSFNVSSSNRITTGSFLSLLTKPIDATISSSSPPTSKRWNIDSKFSFDLSILKFFLLSWTSMALTLDYKQGHVYTDSAGYGTVQNSILSCLWSWEVLQARLVYVGQEYVDRQSGRWFLG